MSRTRLSTSVDAALLEGHARPHTAGASDELLERLDSCRAREGRSRCEVVREAIERFLAADLEAEIDRRIVEAYTRQPPEDVWNEQAAKQMIAAEPW